MKTYSDMRGFLTDDQPPDPARTPDEEKAGVSLPGDPVESSSEINRYIGKNPQSLLRILQSGSLSQEQESLVTEAISVFEAISGENLTGGVQRAVPVPAMSDRMAVSGVDSDVLANPDFDPSIADLFR